jgi:DHA2 family multidrug resistance protein-like MFS transporter
VDLLARPAVALSVGGGLIAFVASMTALLSLPFRLQQHYGFSPGEVGTVLAPWPLGMLIMAPFAGALSDRFPAGVLGAIGMSVATAGLLLLAFLPDHLTLVGVSWRMILCGMGFGLFLTPNSRVIVYSAPPQRAASAGGLISTARLVGQTLGATVMAALLSMGLGSNQAPALVAATLAAIAGVCSVARLNPTFKGRRDSEAESL